MDIFATDFNLEASLAEDNSGTGLRQIKDTLLQMQSKIRRKMDSGLTTNEFTLIQELSLAVDTSLKLVDIRWKELHK